ncbi:MAG: metallophosphoesterase [Chitinophagaceae bacterium]
MKRLLGSWIFIIIMVLIDLYVFQSLKLVTSSLSTKLRMSIHLAYWSFTAAAVILFLVIPYIQFETLPKFIRVYVIAILFGFFIAKFIAMIFFLVDDLRRVLQWGGIKTYQMVKGGESSVDTISRSLFLSWLGIGVGGGLFGTLLYGFGNKYRYRVEKLKLNFDNLPSAFKGIKIIQISDIHSGSLDDHAAVEKGIKKINDLNPDLIFFTGDLVNNAAKEMEGKIELFSSLKASMGVYSILGNHDYGDYVSWPSQEAKKENLETLKSIHAQMGWRLLINENLTIEKDGESICVIGVENWGARANFPKYGDLKKAYEGSEKHPFKILLSHDPSHWDAEVCKEYGDIDLTLSGHTHGMQFGVEIPGFRWSPVQYVYKQWGGLYKKEKQHLYVNRGFGFLGYPGRVGILPEITMFELA